MNVREALWKLLSEAKCPDGFAEANNEEQATHIAPIIERALRKTYRAGYTDGCELERLRAVDDDRGVTAGVAAMMEES